MLRSGQIFWVVTMLNTLGGFVVGIIFGVILALSFPHQIHSGLAKVGLGSIGASASETVK
jgi:hypothetical protein